jgi:hypothetical protein
VALRQKIPDRRILLPQNPGAETLQSIFLDELIALFEGAQVGKEDPFAHLVAVKIKVRGAVRRIPLDVAAVRLGELQSVGSADVLAVGLGLSGLSSVSLVGVPVYQ